MRKNIKLGLICLTSLLLAGCRPINLYFSNSGSGSAPSSGSGSTQTPPAPGPLPDPDSGSSDSSNQQNKVTLTLDPAGGTINGSTEPVVNEYDVGATVELPLPTWANEDQTFDGWYDGDTKVENLYVINDSSATKTLIAHWIKQVFNVTLNPGEGGSVNQINHAVKTGTEYSLEVPTRKGYTFKAWEYNGTALTDDTGKSLDAWNLTQDVTLTASYVAINYTLQFKFTTWDDTVYASKSFNFDMNLNEAFENNFASTNPAPNLPAPIWGWHTRDNYENEGNYITTTDDLVTDEVNKTITVYSRRAYTPGDPKSHFTVENGVLISSVASNVPTDLNLNHLFVEGKRITGIEAGAFTGNTTLTTIYIPKSVTSIKRGAFTGLTSLTTIRVEYAENDVLPSGWEDFTTWADKVQWEQ